MKLLSLCLALALLAGCNSSASGSDEPLGQESDALAGGPPAGIVRTWSGTFNLTTRGAWSFGPFYPHWPSNELEGTHEHNCLSFTLRGVHLLGVQATATWEPSATEQRQMLFHFLKDDPGPFRGANHTVGGSPLGHGWSFDNESTHWLRVGVHPQDMAVDRGDTDFRLDFTMTYRSYNGSEPAFLGPDSCFYPVGPLFDAACLAGGCVATERRAE